MTDHLVSLTSLQGDRYLLNHFSPMNRTSTLLFIPSHSYSLGLTIPGINLETNLGLIFVDPQFPVSEFSGSNQYASDIKHLILGI